MSDSKDSEIPETADQLLDRIDHPEAIAWLETHKGIDVPESLFNWGDSESPRPRKRPAQSTSKHKHAPPPKNRLTGIDQLWQQMGLEATAEDILAEMERLDKARGRHHQAHREYVNNKNQARSKLKKRLHIGELTVEAAMHTSALAENGLYDEQRAKDKAEADARQQAREAFEASVMSDLAELPTADNPKNGEI